MKRFLTALVVMALMFAVPSFATVTIETARVQYNCNGTTTAYTYPFEIIEDDDLLVITANSAGFLTWLYKTAQALKQIVTLEEYKNKPGLKGVENLKKQVVPRTVRTLTENREEN